MIDSLELMGEPARDISPQLDVQDETETYARLIAEPLEAGYGITLGNSLRRVLLSSLEGAAITSVRIDQVEHEFSTITGVQEDTTELLLNLKEIRIKPLSNRTGTLLLDVRGPAAVTASDIQVPADFEVVNPGLHIARLDNSKAHLNVEMHVELGKGYVPAGSVEGLPIGVIPVDAVFTPIRKVNYRVEKTRVGQSTNFDRLILEVWTDGTIGAVEAVGQAADLLIDQFALFGTVGRPISSASGSASAGGGMIAPDRYNTAIEELQLSVRAYNCLKRSGLMTVGQVLEKNEDELLGLRNFGRKSYDELRDKLIELGYVDGAEPGLVPKLSAPVVGGLPARQRPVRVATSAVILDEEDEEQSLGALGKALKEALKEVGDEDLLGADDED